MKWLMPLVVWLACGGGATALNGGHYDQCKRECDRQKRCAHATDETTNTCNASCDSNKDAFSQLDVTCVDWETQYSQAVACYSMDCAKIAPCLQMVDLTCKQ